MLVWLGVVSHGVAGDDPLYWIMGFQRNNGFVLSRFGSFCAVLSQFESV